MEKSCVLSKFKPAVPKYWLLIVAGLLWSGVGLMLVNMAFSWLAQSSGLEAALLGGAGLVASMAASFWGFSKIARKNIDRIHSLDAKACFFSFQAWKGYLIIASMITLGVFLRNSAFPKNYLSVLYTTIGGALFQASFHYYVHFLRFWRTAGAA